MPRYTDPEMMRQIREEQDRLLADATPPRNKKKYRAETKAQREADLSYRIPDPGFYQRFMAHLERLTLDLKAERSRRNARK